MNDSFFESSKSEQKYNACTQYLSFISAKKVKFYLLCLELLLFELRLPDLSPEPRFPEEE